MLVLRMEDTVFITGPAHFHSTLLPPAALRPASLPPSYRKVLVGRLAFCLINQILVKRGALGLSQTGWISVAWGTGE